LSKSKEAQRGEIMCRRLGRSSGNKLKAFDGTSLKGEYAVGGRRGAVAKQAAEKSFTDFSRPVCPDDPK